MVLPEPELSVHHQDGIHPGIAQAAHEPGKDKGKVRVSKVAKETAQFFDPRQLLRYELGDWQRQHAVASNELDRHIINDCPAIFCALDRAPVVTA